MPNLAIVVGIDKYWTALNGLTGAVADAIELASWLLGSGEVAAERIYLGLHPDLHSPPVPPALAASPVFEPTLDGLDALLTDLVDNPPADVERLWFYFSGHGASSSNPAYVAEAICLKDFTDHAHRKALEIASLRGVLNGIPAERRFVLIDGCRDQVFRDDIRFGTLSRQPRAAPGVPRNFELRATSAGRTAVEAGGRGLFGQHLLAGLRGEGGAKRWDPNARDGEGAYIVHWRALSGFVAERVSKPGGLAPDQLVTDMGERPANDDPELARFDPDTFGRLKLYVHLRQPEPSPVGARIWARRNDSLDEEIADPASANPVTLELVPSAWVVFAKCEGYRSRPRQKAIAVYENGIALELELEPKSPAPLLPHAKQPHLDILAARGLAKREPPRLGAGFGILEIFAAGCRIDALNPPLRVSIFHETGALEIEYPFPQPLALKPGVYRVRLELPDGSADEQMAGIEAGESDELRFRLPERRGGALTAALAVANKPPPREGLIQPSEPLGWLAGASLVTVASIAWGQAVQHFVGDLAQLGLGDGWQEDGRPGVQIVIANDEASDTGQRLALTPKVYLWRMFETNRGDHRRLLAANPAVPISSARFPVEPAGYWVELEDADGRRRSGFKLATAVLPGHATLVVRHPVAAGRVEVLQFAVPLAASHDFESRRYLTNGLVHAEALQRARLHGRDPLSDPTVAGLARGDWFEPFSALLVAAALLDRSVAEEAARTMLETLFTRLKALDAPLADLSILMGAVAERAGDPVSARMHFATALALRQAPVVDKLLDAFARGLDAHGFTGEVRDWVAEKTRQAVSNPLWTLRREDDINARQPP
jgi:hypothetical protein